MTFQLPSEAWQVLDEEFHRPLILDLENVARGANIPLPMTWARVADYCSDGEIAYLRTIRRQAARKGRYGLVLTGQEPGVSPFNRFTAVAGACLRNYLNARVVTLQELLDAIKVGSVPEPSVLLTPNFFVGQSRGGRIAEWQTQGLLSLLYRRQSQGLQTFLYVSDLDELAAAYGPAFARHLRDNYCVVRAE